MQLIIKQALQAKFQDSKLVENLMTIIEHVDSDTNGHIVSHMLLGLYEKPVVPNYLLNISHNVVGEVVRFNPIEDKVEIEYNRPEKETWYYPTKEDQDNDTNGTNSWDTGRKMEYSKQIPTGKFSKSIDSVKLSAVLSGKNQYWKLVEETQPAVHHEDIF